VDCEQRPATRSPDGDGPGDPLGTWSELVDVVGEMLALVHSSDVVELEVSVGASHLALRRSAPSAAPPAAGPDGAPGTEDGAPLEPFLAVTSPLVGIFRPSVQVGDRVAAGQPLGAIEALGMPTSVDAPASGTVEELLTGEGSPVEFGQSLLVLRLDHRP